MRFGYDQAPPLLREPAHLRTRAKRLSNGVGHENRIWGRPALLSSGRNSLPKRRAVNGCPSSFVNTRSPNSSNQPLDMRRPSACRFFSRWSASHATLGSATGRRDLAVLGGSTCQSPRRHCSVRSIRIEHRSRSTSRQRKPSSSPWRAPVARANIQDLREGQLSADRDFWCPRNWRSAVRPTGDPGVRLTSPSASPQELLAQVDRVRHKRGESRSQYFRNAAAARLTLISESWVEVYRRGYVEQPEDPNDVEAATKAAVALDRCALEVWRGEVWCRWDPSRWG